MKTGCCTSTSNIIIGVFEAYLKQLLSIIKKNEHVG